jgi:hypothetical protein
MKPLSEFSFKNKQKKLLVSYCKDCNRIYQRTHYKNNPLDYSLKRKEWRAKFRVIIRGKIVDYFKNHPCVDCGEKDYIVLEFDHVKGDKKSDISSLFSNDTSWEIIENEIKKCEVRCANCHKRRSAKQLGWYKYME